MSAADFLSEAVPVDFLMVYGAKPFMCSLEVYRNTYFLHRLEKQSIGLRLQKRSRVRGNGPFLWAFRLKVQARWLVPCASFQEPAVGPWLSLLREAGLWERQTEVLL